MAAEGVQVRVRVACGHCGGRGNLEDETRGGGYRKLTVPCPAGCDGGWEERWVPVAVGEVSGLALAVRPGEL